MTRKMIAVSGVLGAALAVPFLGLSGCGGTLFRNLTKEKTGDVQVQFINTTPYRAIFTYGSYDAWDQLTPGAVNMFQTRIEGNTTTDPNTVTCARDVVIGTQAFLDRATATKADLSATNFDAEAFQPTVSFSSGATGSPTAGLPTQGTALGVDKLLGVDFSCGDLLIFKFVQDPDAPGGFRIDFEVVRDVIPGQEPPTTT
jgi:hypothetical protein